MHDLFGHVAARAYIAKNLYIDIGRFSYGAISRVRMFNNANFSGLAAKFGDFCEFSEARIMLGGEHTNSVFNNFSFGSSLPFQKLLAKENIPTQHGRKGPVEVGDGVIFSHGSTVLSGVKINHGVVIGANALITKDCDAFGIYGGNPASKIATRQVEPYHLQNLSKLNVLGIIKYLKDPSSTTNSDLINRSKDDKVLIMIHFSNDFKSEGGSFDFRILGALIDNKNYPLVKGSEFYNYCSQITSATEGKEVEWVLDPLSLKMT